MTPRFYGKAFAELDEEDGQVIVVEVTNAGWSDVYPEREAFCALDCQAAARLAEQIDAAIELSARTTRAKAETKAARIAALKEALAELGAA